MDKPGAADQIACVGGHIMDYEFRDPMRLARVVRVAVIIWTVVAIGYASAAAFSALTIGAFQAGTANMEDLARVDTVSAIAGVSTLVVNLITMILVARWIYRANKNAHALSSDMVMTPGWNIGFFFIPIASLWKPFEGISQTWRASVSPSDPESVEIPGWLKLWWGCWIASSILGNISFRLSLGTQTLDSLSAGGWIDAAALPFDLISAYTLLQLVAQLSQIQHDARDVEAQQVVFE